MKTLIVLIVIVTLLVATSAHTNGVSKGKSPPGTDSINILSSPYLIDITKTWINEYNIANPEVALSVTGVHDQELNELLQTSNTIGLFSKNYLSSSTIDENWKIVVGRDVIVPVMNPANPFREEILQKGISPQEFARLFTTPDERSWGVLLSSKLSAPVTPYAVSEQSIRSYLAEFLRIDKHNITYKETENTKEMLDFVRNDRFAIAFCRLADILIIEDQEIEPGISLIPVDKNGNDRIDLFEDIYHSTSELLRGIWIGKYPRGLYNKLYMVTGDRPIGSNELAFLEWVVTEGQQFLGINGFSDLIYSERHSYLQQIKDYSIPIIEFPARASQPRIFMIIMGVLLLAGLILYLLIRIFSTGKWEAETVHVGRLSVFDENSVTFPGGLFFDKSHTWIFMEKDGQVRIGIDDFLQHVTGPITRVKLKKPGDVITKGDAFLSLIQHGKQLDIQSPLSGIIREHNTGLVTDSDIINDAPFSDGWMYLVEPLNWLKEIQTYVMGDKYREWLKAEFSRLKNFFSSGLKSLKIVNSELVLQSGGEITDGVLESYGPEAWEEFQSGFLRSAR